MLSTSANVPSDKIASAFHWRGFLPVSTLSRIRAESAGGGLLLATDCPIPASTMVVLAGIRTGSSLVRANPPRHAGSRTYTAPPPPPGILLENDLTQGSGVTMITLLNALAS